MIYEALVAEFVTIRVMRPDLHKDMDEALHVFVAHPFVEEGLRRGVDLLVAAGQLRKQEGCNRNNGG